MDTGKVLLGMLAGVTAGALLGVLFAPDKGSKTRKRICREGEELTEDLKEKFDEFVDSITEKIEKVKKDVFTNTAQITQISNKNVAQKQDSFPTTENIDGNEMRIGKIVQSFFKKAFNENLLTQEDIQNLQDKNYCKRKFKKGKEVLKPIEVGEKGITDNSGIKRYYADTYGGKYYLFSQWTKDQLEPFQHWKDEIQKH